MIYISLLVLSIGFSPMTHANDYELQQVSNAGLVLSHVYIPTYFARLKLTYGQQFVSKQAQVKAVHFLQLLATGAGHYPESDLSLNKLLCGLSAEDSIEFNFVPTQEELLITEELLKAMIANWRSLGNISVESLRESFILRNGDLVGQPEGATLKIPRVAFDVLLSGLPYAISPIKLPWMTKPLYVTW